MLVYLIVTLIIFTGICRAENDFTSCSDLRADSSEKSSDRINTDDWSFLAEINQYIISDENDFLLPAFTADKDWLHIEARYNYEALESGSAWIGYNFNAGNELELNATPMFGAVIGSIMGIAPGIEMELTYGILDIYSEWEYVFDLENSSDNFLYTWSEISVAPADWISLGIVAQRTKVYQSEVDIQRGMFSAFMLSRYSFTAYVFNPDIDKPTLVLNASIEF
jgi:hypothetical protein